jgi:hypothetical protein
MNRLLLVITSAWYARLGWLALLHSELRTPLVADIESCAQPRPEGVCCEVVQGRGSYC